MTAPPGKRYTLVLPIELTSQERVQSDGGLSAGSVSVLSVPLGLAGTGDNSDNSSDSKYDEVVLHPGDDSEGVDSETVMGLLEVW